MYPLRLSPIQVHREAETYPSYHWSRDWVDPGQVTITGRSYILIVQQLR